MDFYKVNGGKKLTGSVTISGAKNAAAAIIPAVILCGKPCKLENIPDIEDVAIEKRILTDLGADVQSGPPGCISIDPSGINSQVAIGEEMSRLRASYYMLGALLGRYGYAKIAQPGGCALGERPIDLHLKGLRALGAQINCDETQGIITASANMLVGTEIYLDIASVGATINIMMAACCAVGTTIINNVAKEPHVVDVANFLNMMGAKIKGAGTETIRIVGVDRASLRGCSYCIIPDQIEAGTFMIAAAATMGDVIIKNIIPTHLEAITAKLMESGVSVTEGDDGSEYYLHVSANKRPRAIKLETCTYPGFPTDLQQPMMAFLSMSCGDSVIIEKIFTERFRHVKQLNTLGADIELPEDGKAIIHGVQALSGSDIYVSDLRAGAALMIAALMAEGETRVHNIHYIDRGYENLCTKLCSLGANVERISGDN